MGLATASVKAKGLNYPRLSGLPAALHDVADLAHSADVGVADAGIIRTTVAISEEAIARPLQDRPLFGRGIRHGSAELAGHLSVERREAGITADRYLTATARIGAIEAWPSADGLWGRRGGLSRRQWCWRRRERRRSDRIFRRRRIQA